MKINIDGNLISVIIVKKRIKNIYFRIDDNLNLLVNANKWVREKEIFKIIEEKLPQIKRMYEIKLNEKDKDAYFYFLGEKYNIEYNDNLSQVCMDSENVYTKDDKMLDNFYIDKCKEIFQTRLDRMLQLFPNVKCILRIRKMKTRWGVCNAKTKIVTLNSELLKKEITLIDYVIIHELCHFKYLNHSKYFWNEVEKYYPYYKRARNMLKY